VLLASNNLAGKLASGTLPVVLTGVPALINQSVKFVRSDVLALS
jgi:hypothetical protein